MIIASYSSYSTPTPSVPVPVHLALRLCCCCLHPGTQSGPGRLLSPLEAPGSPGILKAEKPLLFLPSPGRGDTAWNGALPLLTETERRKQKTLLQHLKRLRALSASGITFRNIVLLPYLSCREQLLSLLLKSHSG